MSGSEAISQRDLRFRSREIMDAVERGESFTVTRDGRGIAELIPPYTAFAARMYGRMCSAVVALDRKPRSRTAHLMIAATAAAEGLPLYTTNPDDYRGLAPLVKITPIPRPQPPAAAQL